MSEELYNTEDLLLNTPEHLKEGNERNNISSTQEDDLLQDEMSELKTIFVCYYSDLFNFRL